MRKLIPEVITDPPMCPGATIASAFLAVALIVTMAILITLDVGCATAATPGEGVADAGGIALDG
jgi:hypothetical protein